MTTPVYEYQHWFISGPMMELITSYVEKGIPPGGFLESVIKNDLRGACVSADAANIVNIPAYVNYFYNQAPSSCHGSEAHYWYWLAKFRTDIENFT